MDPSKPKPKNAFEMMKTASAGNKPKSPAAAANSNTTTPTVASSSSSSTPGPAAIFNPAPMFKGSGLGAGPKHVVDEREQPWVEKYRPKNLGEVSAQDHTVAVLKKTLESSNLPHMLFYGPPGTGKTSTILALCKQLFGPDLYRSRVLELNASDERGISVVREKVKNFAKLTVTTNHDPNYPAPPFKIIILDEADSMTQDAQSALRRIMETHSRITRFCLICNYVTRIIEPIASRCSKFRFKPLDVTSTSSRLQEICLKESVDCPPDALSALIKTSDGDLRRAITYLQSASRLHNASKTPLTALSVQEIGGVVPDYVMRDLGRALGVDVPEKEKEKESGGDVEMMVDEDGEEEEEEMELERKRKEKRKRKQGFDGVREAVEEVVRQGFSATQILIQLHDLLILDPLLPPRAKAKIALTLGETDKALTDGADEELQLLSAAVRIRKAITTDGKAG